MALIARRTVDLDQRRIARICRRPAPPPRPEPLQSARWIAVQSMIDHDPELRWLRAVEGEPLPSWEELGIAVPFGEPARANGVAPATEAVAVIRVPVAREEPEPRKWLPAETLRVQLKHLGLIPATYVKGRLGNRLSPEERAILLEYPAPTDRSDCRPGAKARWWGEEPCPYFRCRYHLGASVSQTSGSIRLIRGIDDGGPSCAMDVADAGPITLEEVGGLEGRTRERTRQIETAAIRKLEAAGVRLNDG